MTLLPGQEPVRAPHPARHLFSIAGLVASVAIIVAGFFAAAYYVTSVLTGGNMAAVISAALVDLTNADREAENLSTLTVNPLLTAAAQAKADDMAAKGYFAHVTPDGYQPWHFVQQAGYEYAAAGENLAVNFSDSENVEDAWMKSPTHRANILSAKFTEIGIATAKGEYKGRTTTFVVQMFGAPRAVTTARVEESVVTPVDPEEIAIAVREPEPQILGTEDEVAPTPIEVAPAPSGVSAERLITSPENILRSIYVICGLIVLLAHALTTRLEFRRHHLRHVAAAAFLLVVMAGSLLLADEVIFTDPVIAEAAVE